MAKQYYCFLERFNNYFNRKLIRKSSLEDYQDASFNFFIPEEANGNMTPFDFNPNDNITTEIIANNVPFDPDYFLLLDAEQNIVQRWFVMEQKRNRQGQWLYFLRRDVLADSLDELKDAPVFVEKGMIMDPASPLLMNNEDVRPNQIKKKEVLLKDKTECPWLVIYLKKGLLGDSHGGPNNDGTITLNINVNEDYVYKTLATPITSWSYYQYSQVGNNWKQSNRLDFRTHFYWVTSNGEYIYKMSSIAPSYPSSLSWTNTTRGNLSAAVITQGRLDDAYRARATTMISQANSAFGFNSSNPLLEFDGKIIKDSDGKYWEIRVFDTNNGQEKTETKDVTSGVSPALKSTMLDAWRESATQPTATADDKAFQVRSFYNEYHLEITERKDLQTVLDLGAYTGLGTTDSALFDVICIPYGFTRITNEGWLDNPIFDVFPEKNRSLLACSSLTSQLTSEWVFDLQVLPYCPVQNFITNRQFMELPDDPSACAVLGKHSGDITDIFIVCDTTNITFDIDQNIRIDFLDDIPEAMWLKYVNDCTMIRLCSPNYNGVFEMNLAKNGGQIYRFNVDMTLRPFNPYIHVNPDFNFLYGQDFNDQRGLICGGDFSLGIINDAWKVYEIQNKNYQAIFDRQIQNLDVNNAIARQEAGWNVVAGTIQGTASGAITGGITTGSPYGAIAGAVVGGVASGIGGAMDIANLEKRQQEQRSYAIDNYNLQLGNVRALPYSITKTSALTFNNKLFPFVEIYDCTEVERLAYYEKLWFNGMTIGIIDKMEGYLTYDARYYFRAKLIRFVDISEDNHYLEAVNEELLKGVFI